MFAEGFFSDCIGVCPDRDMFSVSVVASNVRRVFDFLLDCHRFVVRSVHHQTLRFLHVINEDGAPWGKQCCYMRDSRVSPHGLDFDRSFPQNEEPANSWQTKSQFGLWLCQGPSCQVAPALGKHYPVAAMRNRRHVEPKDCVNADPMALNPHPRHIPGSV